MASQTCMVAVIIVTLLAMVLPFVLYASWYRRFPPSMALAVWASQGEAEPYALITGGGMFIPPGGRRTAALDLRLRFLDLVVPKVQMDTDGKGETAKVRVVVLYKVSSEMSALKMAFTNLVGKSDKDVEGIVTDAIVASVREGLAKTTFDKVDGDRDELAFRLLLPAQKVMAASGLEIRGATIAEMELQG